MEDEFTTIEVDLTNRLDEYVTGIFANAVKTILQGLFGAKIPPVKIKGNKAEVKAFTKAVHREKEYLETFQNYGLDNPRTYRSKARLQNAVNKFERATGLKWPFK